MLKEMLKERLEKVKPTKMAETPESKEFYPNIYLNSKELPDIADWDVGGEYYIVLKVEQKSKSIRTENGEDRVGADFDIKEIGVVDESEMEDDMEDDDMEGMMEEDDSKMSLNRLRKKYGG